MNLIQDSTAFTIAATGPKSSTGVNGLLDYGEPTGETVVETTVLDVVEEETTGTFSPLASISFGAGEVVSDTPALATVSGNTLTVEDGVTTGLIKARWRQSKSFGWEPVAQEIASAPSSTTRQKEYVAGSLGAAITSEMEAVLDSEDSSPDAGLFSTYSYPSTFVRNTSGWLYQSGWDLTGLVVAMSNTGDGKRGGVAITRQHVLFAKHFGGISAGRTVYFVDGSNNVVTRTISGAWSGTNLNGSIYGNDMTLAVLDSPLPSSIASYKVLGDYDSRLPSNSTVAEGPLGFWVDQDNESYVCQLFPQSGSDMNTETVNSNTRTPETIGVTHPANSNTQASFVSRYTNYRKASVIDGETVYGPVDKDSGSPVMFPLGGELCVWTCWTTGSSGPKMCNAEDFLNDVIAQVDSDAALSTGETVTLADISSYTTYP